MIPRDGEILSESTQKIRRKVRGRHRRILLLTLSENSGTVSSIATKSGLRVPHVSVELKKMREEGLVDSTSSSGTRGGRINLTQKGHLLLESDELSRIPLVPFNSIVDEEYQIIDVLGNHVLLMVTRKPPSPLIYLPTIDGRTILAETRERNVRYFDSNSFERIASPRGSNLETIEEWDRSGFGLIRLRLVDGQSSDRLSIGRWFNSSLESQSVTDSIESLPGTWYLGSIGRGGSEVISSASVLCTSTSEEIGSQLMKNSSNDSLLIGRQSIIQKPSGPIPRIVLEEWIELIHPRLRPVARRSRLQFLNNWIDSGRSSRPSRLPDITVRRFREDWGNREFLELNDPLPESIATDGLGPLALKALILSIMNNQLVEWISLDLPEPISESLSRRLHRYDRIRLLIAPWSQINDSGMSILLPDEVHDLPFLRLIEPNGRSLPLYIGEETRRVPLLPKGWKIPENVDDLKQVSELLPVLERPMDNDDNNELLIYATSVFPEGDEVFSNRIESVNPLASWISSIPSNRVDRWVRLGNRLPAHWSMLISPPHTQLDRIVDLWGLVPHLWMESFNEVVSKRIIENHESRATIRKLAMYASNSEIRGWAAGRLLSIVYWMKSSESEEIVRWCVNTWLENPPFRCADSLEGVLYLMQIHPNIRQGDFDEMSERIRRLAWSLPESHDLHLWILLSEWNERGTQPTIENQILFVKYIPWRWWSSHSADMLTMMTEHSEARRIILNNSLPWPAIVIRPEGQNVPLPFGFDGKHPKLRLTLADRLRRFLSLETHHSEAINYISDIIDSLDDFREEKSPRNGKTHRYVGWLTRPLDTWPPFHRLQDPTGDSEITLAIGERLGNSFTR